MKPLSGRGHAGRRLTTAALAIALTGVGWMPFVTPSVGRVLAMENQSARIAHSDVGANLRAAPGYDGDVLGILPDGSYVTLRIGEADSVLDADGATRWWPVSSDLGDGWVAGFFLATGPDSPVNPAAEAGALPAQVGGDTGTESWDDGSADWVDPSAASADSADSGGGGGAELWGPTALISEYDGVNFRAQPGPNGQAIKTLAHGTVVGLRIDSADTVWIDGSRWWPVSFDGLEGWVAGDFLAPNDGSADSSGASAADDATSQEAAPDAAPADSAAADTTQDAPQGVPGKSANADVYFSPGSYAAAFTGDGGNLNVRADGAPDAERVGKIPDEGIVQVMDGPVTDPTGSDWYLVTDGTLSGYVAAKFLAPAGEPADGLTPMLAPNNPQSGQVGVASGYFQYPVTSRYTFTQGFGCSPFWFEPWSSYAGCNFHNGIDLAAPLGTPVEAADGGTVVTAGWCDCGLGWYVKIDHGNGYDTLYGHLNEYYVVPGQEVAKGEVIGALGSSGNSTGPHLHFIVNFQGQDLDPLAYLP